MIYVKNNMLLLVITAFSIFSASSCVLTSEYGSVQSVPPGGERITFQKLKERFHDYHISWSGTQETNVIAYLFDPKDDDRRITTHEWWTPVVSEKEMSDLWIFGHGAGDHTPEVYRITGPDNTFYGYLYTSWYYVWESININKIDDTSLWIDFIPVPEWKSFSYGIDF